MLNTFPPAAPPVPPAPLPVPRKRGAQPSNRNALAHGVYAVKNRTPLSEIAAAVSSFRPSLHSGPDLNPGTLRDLRFEIDRAFQHLLKAETVPEMVALLDLILRSGSLVNRLGKSMVLQGKPLKDMLHVSQHALDLIHYDFQFRGIRRDSDSFRKRFERSDFNSPAFQESLCGYISEPEYPFISPRQWSVLEPLLPPSGHTSKRGRPPSDPRELLDAVFWKLAHHARWQDLPLGYPPVLSCRRYYRRLLLSGRLVTIYHALYKDFCSRGRVRLGAFVMHGWVKIIGNRVALRQGSPEIKDTWQVRTALLFLQVGYQSLRKFRYQKVQDRRRKFPTLRRILKERALLKQYIREEKDFSYTPIDLGILGLENLRRRFGRASSSRRGRAGIVKPSPGLPARFSHPDKEIFVPLKI